MIFTSFNRSTQSLPAGSPGHGKASVSSRWTWKYDRQDGTPPTRSAEPASGSGSKTNEPPIELSDTVTTVSGLADGRASSRKTTDGERRRASGVATRIRAPRAASSVSAQRATVSESTTKLTESPSAGSQVAVSTRAADVPPGSVQGSSTPPLSTRSAHDALRGSHSSPTRCSSRRTGPGAAERSVSMRRTTRPPM